MIIIIKVNPFLFFHLKILDNFVFKSEVGFIIPYLKIIATLLLKQINQIKKKYLDFS